MPLQLLRLLLHDILLHSTRVDYNDSHGHFHIPHDNLSLCDGPVCGYSELAIDVELNY